jgi:hypothetical protein
MTELYGNPLPPDFKDNEKLTAAEFNAVKNYWVTDELPDTAEDGDVVFVIEGDAVGGGLPGIGGWATIEEVSGDYTKHTYDDWVAYEWTGDGTVTTSGGLVDSLLVGQGGLQHDSGAGGGGGGAFQSLINVGTVEDISVETRSGIPGNQVYLKAGGPSSLGNWQVAGGGTGYANGNLSGNGFAPAAPAGPGGGAGGKGTNTYPGPGMKSSITGSEVEYGRGGWKDTPATSNPGEGGGGSGGQNIWGNPGRVIIRVPKEYAPSVQENRHGWLHFATVENGVVTSVNKTPDNLPYTAAVDEVPCGSEVSEGWNYDGSEFVAPEPDYSDQIKQLEEQLQTLRGAK